LLTKRAATVEMENSVEKFNKNDFVKTAEFNDLQSQL